MAKKRAKKKTAKGEQLQLIEVGPENLRQIAKETRTYRSFVNQRLFLLTKEVKQKNKVKALVEEAKLQRLPNGDIKFEVDDEIVCLKPQDDLITIKKKEPKKTKKKTSKKGMGDQVKTEEASFEKKGQKK